MSTTRFNVQVRLLECQACGAPVEAALLGGVVRCHYCGASNEVTVRRRSDKAGAAVPSMAEDVARLSRLKAQIESPLTGHVYDLSQPPIGLTEPPEGAARLPWLKQRWAEAKQAAAAGGAPQAQHRLCWVAFRLADAFEEDDKPDYERAVLETALEILSDDGHQHLVRCRIALEAIAEGDLASAEGWLAECDPIPEVPELDSAYRRARAHIAARKGDAASVLALVGREDDAVPLHPSQRNAIRPLRVHALELLGDPNAGAELKKAVDKAGYVLKLVNGKVKGVAVINEEAKARREKFLQRMRKEKLGLRTMLGLRLEERDDMAGGTLHALARQLFKWPWRALLLFVLITIPRCTLDADPFMGANGHVVCPSLCDDCEGPFHVHTYWSQTTDGHSTGGPQYFCRPPDNGIADMSADDVWRNLRGTKYEAYVAPAMTTILMLLAILLLFMPFGVVKVRRQNEARKAELDREITVIAAELREGVRPARPHPKRLRNAFIVATVSVALPLLGTLLELAIR